MMNRHSNYLQNLDKNYIKDNIAKSETDLKISKEKGIDAAIIVTLSIFAAIAIFVVIMIII